MKERKQTFIDRMLGGYKHSLIVTFSFFVSMALHFFGVVFFYENLIYTSITLVILVSGACYAIARALIVMFTKKKRRGSDCD